MLVYIFFYKHSYYIISEKISKIYMWSLFVDKVTNHHNRQIFQNFKVPILSTKGTFGKTSKNSKILKIDQISPNTEQNGKKKSSNYFSSQWGRFGKKF
jgi:hypothetical protein